MASDLTTTAASGAAPSVPSGRFRLVIATMFAVTAVLLVLAGASLRGSDSTITSGDGSWAEWSPGQTGAKGLQEIADHVAPQYRNVDGGQIGTVAGGPLQVAGLPARIAVRNANSDGNIQTVGGTTALFTICGMGSNCSIAVGKPSLERMLLLRREALELALYTFHSDDSVDNVIVLMPPRPGTRNVTLASGKSIQTGNQGTAILFQRSQLESRIDAPLTDTIPPDTPKVTTIASAPEARTVAKLTAPGMFMVSVIQAQDGNPYFVLDPLS